MRLTALAFWAATIVAAGSALAADVPVRQSLDSQFVEVCPEFPVGFYKIPGTDTCLHLGGYARLHWSYGGTNTGAVPNFAWNRASSLQTSYSRLMISADARPMTDFGRGRIYIMARQQVATDGGGVSGGLPWTAPTDTPSIQTAFVQLAGWTFGYRQSVYDYLDGRNLMLEPIVGSNRWTTMISYQVKLAPGLEATLSAEDAGSRNYPILQVDPLGQLLPGATVPPNGVPGFSSLAGLAGKSPMPDVVGRLQYSGAWGDIAAMGALHEVRPAFSTVAGAGFPALLPAFPGSAAGLPGFAKPDSRIGGAAQIGLTLKTAGGGNPKVSDELMGEIGFARGALDYTLACGSEINNAACFGGILASKGPLGNFLASRHNFLVLTGDGVFNPASGALDLTGWMTAQVRYRHFWNPQWRSVFGGGYTRVNFTGPAQASTSSAAGVFVGSDFSILQAYTELIWSPYSDLDLGITVTYTRVDPQGPKSVDDVASTFRAQWNF